MAQHIARKPITLNGKTYKRGDVVPLERVPDKLRKQLIDQRRVVPDAVRASPATLPPRKER